jgi:archaemetzincin
MKDSGKIYIAPVKFHDSELFRILRCRLTTIFELPTAVYPLDTELSSAFDSRRSQYNASRIIRLLGYNVPVDCIRILIVVNVDLYVEDMRFVFGLALRGGPAALISLARLRQEFYRMKPDTKLFRERCVKEAVHELGHTFGMNHCKNPSCVMFFSNSLPDTDRKSSSFCPLCTEKLKRLR